MPGVSQRALPPPSAGSSGGVSSRSRSPPRRKGKSKPYGRRSNCPASRRVLKSVAIDDLPLPVVNFLNVIGVPWPYLNEDTVSEFAGLVREFRAAVATTHEDATEAVAAITRAHQSVSTEVMQSGWTSLTARHVDELTAGCTVLADALEVAAGYIVAQKAEAIGVLVGMAAAFVADQAASVVTFGLAEAAMPAIVAGAEAVVRSLAADIEQYLLGWW